MHNKQHTTHTHIQSHTIHLSIAPSDYGALTGFSLGPFSNNVRHLSFNVSIVDDMIPEDDELFTASLTLSDPVTYGEIVTVAPDLANVTILDDDGKSCLLRGAVIAAPNCIYRNYVHKITKLEEPIIFVVKNANERQIASS